MRSHEDTRWAHRKGLADHLALDGQPKVRALVAHGVHLTCSQRCAADKTLLMGRQRFPVGRHVQKHLASANRASLQDAQCAMQAHMLGAG